MEQRINQAPPGTERRVGVGRTSDASNRCKAKHDIPWSERCVLPAGHEVLPGNAADGVLMHKHRDKRGGTW